MWLLCLGWFFFLFSCPVSCGCHGGGSGESGYTSFSFRSHGSGIFGFGLCLISSLSGTLGFDLYFVEIQTRNHPTVSTRSTDDPLHRVRPEHSVGRGSIFRSPIPSGRLRVNPKPDPTRGQPY